MARTSKTQKDADERETEAERNLDEAIEELFPASDPLAVTRTSAGAPDNRTTKQPRPAAGGHPKRK